MNHKKPFAILLLIFAAAIAATAQSGYKSATEKVKVGEKTLVVETEIYVNLMPTVVDEKQKQDCPTGRFVAPVTLRTSNNSRLPRLKLERIWISSGGVWRKYKFNKKETSPPDSSIYSIVRGCFGEDFKVNEPVKIVVEIKRRGRSYFVASRQTRIEKVY